MSVPQLQPEIPTVVVRRTLNAPRDKVFRAWTEPAMLHRWFTPAGYTLAGAEVDLRVGGAYSLAMQPPDAPMYRHGGTYREIDPPSRLVFTWVIENQACEGSQDVTCETLVTIELSPRGDATELVLTHELLPTEQARTGHAAAWNSCLDSLATVLAG